MRICRPIVASLWYSGIRATGLPALVRRFRNAGVVLCYHNVAVHGGITGVGDPSLHMDLERFFHHLRWLVAHYRLVPLSELVSRLNARQPLGGIIALTFDDAYAGVFSHAWPVLQEFGVPATVFVIANAPDECAPFWWDHPAAQRVTPPAPRPRWMTDLHGDGPSILRQLAAEPWPSPPPAHRPAPWGVLAAAVRSGIDLGVHSATHRALPCLSDAELANELITSREVVARHTGAVPEFFAHPYGLWDNRVRNAVKAAGYRAACTLDYGLITHGVDPWALPRVNVPATIGPAAFQAWIGGLRYPRGGRR
jgi:peptidoglycan/xylan/chitin deacetylase (PgdA/CDA1 family)